MNINLNSLSTGAVVSLTKWLAEVGVTQITAWRWRRRGWLKTVNIAGRQYLTQEAIDEFHRRAVAGEFSQEHKVPSRMNHLGETCEERESQGGGGGGQILPARAAKIAASSCLAPAPADVSISSGGVRLPQSNVGFTSETTENERNRK